MTPASEMSIEEMRARVAEHDRDLYWPKGSNLIAPHGSIFPKIVTELAFAKDSYRELTAQEVEMLSSIPELARTFK